MPRLRISGLGLDGLRELAVADSVRKGRTAYTKTPTSLNQPAGVCLLVGLTPWDDLKFQLPLRVVPYFEILCALCDASVFPLR